MGSVESSPWESIDSSNAVACKVSRRCSRPSTGAGCRHCARRQHVLQGPSASLMPCVGYETPRPNDTDRAGVSLSRPDRLEARYQTKDERMLDSLRKCATFSGVAPPPEYGLLFLCSAWARELRLSEPCERRLRGGAFQGKTGSLPDGNRQKNTIS
jgi:hypothetical protein